MVDAVISNLPIELPAPPNFLRVVRTPDQGRGEFTISVGLLTPKNVVEIAEAMKLKFIQHAAEMRSKRLGDGRGLEIG